MPDPAVPMWWMVDDVLSAAECEAWIARIEAAGPSEAPITTAHGFEMRRDIRNNDRAIIDDVPFAEELYRRLGAHIPDQMFNWSRCGLNERFRCYRYSPGQYFATHRDGAFRRSRDEISMLTVMVYLNDGFEGGETAFVDLEETAIPKRGSALLFQHALLHEGCRVTKGLKYVLRSDAMFRRPAS